MRYYGENGDELQLPFNFRLMGMPWNAKAIGARGLRPQRAGLRHAGQGRRRLAVRAGRGYIVIDSLKLAEDGSGDVIVRLFESMRTATRCTLESALPVKSAAQTNLVEEETGKLVWKDGRVTLDFRPFEVKTVRLSL